MRLQWSKLRQIVREELLEAVETPEEVTLSDGSSVDHGGPEHKADMEQTLAGLETLKKQHKYGTASRAAYASAQVHLKRLINRTRPSRVKEEHLPEDPPRTFAQLEDKPPEALDSKGGKPSGFSRNAQPIPYSPGVNRRKG